MIVDPRVKRTASLARLELEYQTTTERIGRAWEPGQVSGALQLRDIVGRLEALAFVRPMGVVLEDRRRIREESCKGIA